MFRRFTLLIPSPQSWWERWSCPSATVATMAGSTESPALPVLPAGRTILALPAQLCRTFALRIPLHDPATARQLALAQLEKRGLASGANEHAGFACLTIPLPDGSAILSVDVPSPVVRTSLSGTEQPAGVIASARCYTTDVGSLILLSELGRRVLWAVRDGQVIQTQILSTSMDQPEQVAAEIRIASLTLQQQELIAAPHALMTWDGFDEEEMKVLSSALGLPVCRAIRPVPDPANISKLATTRLLPAPSGGVGRPRQLKWLKGAAAAILIAGGALWGLMQHRSLAALERKAAELGESLTAAAGSDSAKKALQLQVRATQERWQSLKPALDSARYPMIHLNRLTHCLGEGSIVLSRFESKGADVAVSGTAQTAMEAYTFYSTVTADAGLRIYGWSMVQPLIADNGTASFQIKGKMR